LQHFAGGFTRRHRAPSDREHRQTAMDMPAGQPTPRRLRCYVVEDSPIIRQNLIATLEELLDVEIVGLAEDEQGAVEWIRHDGATRVCDLMIIDLFLKSGTGMEVLRHARTLRPHTHLAVLTNYATAEMRRRCEALGADRVFDKSAELEDLLAYCDDLAGRLAAGEH
jgi:DNA-binding NarL/FixJ family response regulator